MAVPSSRFSGASQPRARACLLTTIFAFTLQAGSALAQSEAAPGATVNLPVFHVSTSRREGNQAGNSVSATRIDTPIKDLPFAVAAFTEQFTEDIGAHHFSAAQ